jgi:hypothetical protein
LSQAVQTFALSTMRAALRVQALVGDLQPLDGAASNQVLGDDLGGVFGFDATIPVSLRIDHNRRTMFALVQAAGFVDPNSSDKASFADELLKPRVQFARSILRAGRPGRVGGTGVVADKDVAFKTGQTGFSFPSSEG